MLLRISAVIGLLLGVILLPWWLELVLLLIAIWLLPRLYEVILIGLVFDLLYGVPTESWFSLRFLATIVTLILVCGLDIAKEHVNLFPKPLSR